MSKKILTIFCRIFFYISRPVEAQMGIVSFSASLWSVVTLGMANSPQGKKPEEEFSETLLANQSLLFLLVLANHCTSDRGLKNPYRDALFSFTNSQGRGYLLVFISCMLGIFFLSSAVFFKINFFKYSFWNTIRVSNSLNPDQARHFVEPDLGLNC